ILFGFFFVAAYHVPPPTQGDVLDRELGLALLTWDQQWHCHPIVVDHFGADLAHRALTYAQNVVDVVLLQCGDGVCANHPAIGYDAHAFYAELAAQTVNYRGESGYVRSVAGPQERSERPVGAVEHDTEHHLLEMRTIVLAVS